MNALSPPTPKKLTFPEAKAAAFAWRGACISKLAEAEQRVSALLERLARHPSYAAIKPAYPHLVGQRYERLRKLLAVDGPLKSHAEALSPELDRVSKHDTARTFLCHGQLEIARTEQGEFLYLLRLLKFEKREATRQTLALTREEADTLLADVSGATDALTRRLQALVRSLA